MLVAIWLAFGLFALAELRSLLIVVLRFATSSSAPEAPPSAHFPSVVIQIPAYREHLVLDRLLQSIARLTYPASRLAVQVLDDSEGPEAALTEAVVQRYQSAAAPVAYLHRPSRTGYKPGNLNYGLQFVTADLVAIVDADCELYPDFLARAVPYFEDAKTGGVQARWDYRNDGESPLTVLQAAALDSLFCFENAVRHRLGLSAIFLGSGGIWRSRLLRELGWQETPFTAEDIDLSFRCRRAGWFVAYQPHPLLSCELPHTFLAYKSQQRRWARSCFQLLFDHLPHLLRGGARGLLEASMLLRLLGLQFLLLLATLASFYTLWGLPRTASWVASQILLSGLMIVSPMLLQLVLTLRMTHPGDWRWRAAWLLRALPLGIGLALTLVAGFCDTLWNPRREWEKTLRLGEAGTLSKSRRNWLYSAGAITLAEVSFAALTLAGLVAAICGGYHESLLPLAMFATGFVKSAVTSLSEMAAAARFDTR